jgi:hypothetical protein
MIRTLVELTNHSNTWFMIIYIIQHYDAFVSKQQQLHFVDHFIKTN